jgi:hypothetical protein
MVERQVLFCTIAPKAYIPSVLWVFRARFGWRRGAGMSSCQPSWQIMLPAGFTPISGARSLCSQQQAWAILDTTRRLLRRAWQTTPAVNLAFYDRMNGLKALEKLRPARCAVTFLLSGQLIRPVAHIAVRGRRHGRRRPAIHLAQASGTDGLRWRRRV